MKTITALILILGLNAWAAPVQLTFDLLDVGHLTVVAESRKELAVKVMNLAKMAARHGEAQWARLIKQNIPVDELKVGRALASRTPEIGREYETVGQFLFSQGFNAIDVKFLTPQGTTTLQNATSFREAALRSGIALEKAPGVVVSNAVRFAKPAIAAETVVVDSAAASAKNIVKGGAQEAALASKAAEAAAIAGGKVAAKSGLKAFIKRLLPFIGVITATTAAGMTYYNGGTHGEAAEAAYDDAVATPADYFINREYNQTRLGVETWLRATQGLPPPVVSQTAK